MIYNNAFLKVYNVPVLYFPKFFHPDPSVKRQSGFLKPRYKTSSLLGSSFYAPYFQVISDNKDATIRPTYWDKEIENNPERKAKLDAAGIGTYSLMLAEFNNRYINYVSFMRANFTEEQMEEVEGSDEEMYIEMIYCII